MSEDLPDSAHSRTLARTILTKALRLRPKESLTIESWTHTLSLAAAFVVEARRLGAHPVVLYNDESAYWDSKDEAKPELLGTVGKAEWAALRNTDAYVYFPGPADFPRWESFPMKVIDRITLDWQRWGEVARKARVRGCDMIIGRATEPAARNYGVSLSGWRKELLEATAVDPTPMALDGHKIARKLREGRTLKIVHENGTTLTLGLRHRVPHVDDGMVDAADVAAGNNFINAPSGLILVPVDERVAEGQICSNRPDRHRTGLRTDGRWKFEGGRLRDYSYTSGQEAFAKGYAKAGRGRDRPALFSIGLNPKIHEAPLLEDQEAGVVTFYIGGNSDQGGSTVYHHPWFRGWIMLRGADVAVDGQEVLSRGKLT